MTKKIINIANDKGKISSQMSQGKMNGMQRTQRKSFRQTMSIVSQRNKNGEINIHTLLCYIHNQALIVDIVALSKQEETPTSSPSQITH